MCPKLRGLLAVANLLAGDGGQLVHLPLGVGVVIPPWNFPCAILTGMTMGPVAVGSPLPP